MISPFVDVLEALERGPAHTGRLPSALLGTVDRREERTPGVDADEPEGLAFPVARRLGDPGKLEQLRLASEYEIG